jgi:hypothetical protein
MDHARDPCPWVILNDFGGAVRFRVPSDDSRLCTNRINSSVWEPLVVRYGMVSKVSGMFTASL